MKQEQELRQRLEQVRWEFENIIIR